MEGVMVGHHVGAEQAADVLVPTVDALQLGFDAEGVDCPLVGHDETASASLPTVLWLFGQLVETEFVVGGQEFFNLTHKGNISNEG